MKRLFVSVAIVASVFASNPARADHPGGHGTASKRQVPLAQALSGPAKESFEAAQVLVNNGDFSGAYAKFGQAYELSKDPRLLFDMAVCSRNLHDYAHMQGLLLRYEREAGESMSTDDRAGVESALATIRTLVGSVKLSVSEPEAAVAIDGERIGTTPIDEPIVLNLGKHTLSITKEGFTPIERALDIAGGSETPLGLSMVVQRHVGRLIVASDDGATVVVDGQSAARGHLDVQLPSGPHQVQVTEAGKRPFQSQVDLRDDETRSLDVTLESESHSGRIWPWIAGGAAVAIGAAVGGYFLFKPGEQTTPVPPGKTGTFQLSAWRL